MATQGLLPVHCQQLRPPSSTTGDNPVFTFGERHSKPFLVYATASTMQNSKLCSGGIRRSTSAPSRTHSSLTRLDNAHISHRELTGSQTIDCDVCIIGSGAGSGMLAEGLAQAGFDVVMLEAGEHRTQKDFNMDEGVAFARLYQEGGLRATDDLSITILQGECVGGTTTINWTTCFRTPDPILTQWQHRYGLTDLTNENLTPHFEAVEKRLNISEWPKALANANNQIIFRGCEALGWESTPLKRNVKGCANSGYCSMGCPVNAKQGMLVTTIPAAVDAGMRLYTNTRADVLVQRTIASTASPQAFGIPNPPQNRNNAHHPPQGSPSPPVVQSMAQPSFCAQGSTTTIEWACVPLFILWLQWERCSMNPFRVFMGHHNPLQRIISLIEGQRNRIFH